jgi:hypothetical protein
MAWKEIKPTRSKNVNSEHVANSVRVSFSKPKGTSKAQTSSLSIYIGINVASKMGIQDGDKINFYIDDENPRKWLIKKSISKDTGYKISSFKKDESKAAYLKLQMTWRINEIVFNEDDYRIRTTRHDFQDGGILIYDDYFDQKQ